MKEWVKNVNELEFLRNLAGKQQEINDANSRLEEMARSSATSTAEDPNKLFNVPDARAAATVGPEAMVAANSRGQVGRQIEYNPSIVDKSTPDLNDVKVLTSLVRLMAQEYYGKLEKEGQRFGSPNSATDGATVGNQPAAPQGMSTPNRTAPPSSSGGGSRYYEENTGSPPSSSGGGSRYYEENTGSPPSSSGGGSRYYEENTGSPALGVQPSSNSQPAPKRQVGFTKSGGEAKPKTRPDRPKRQALDVNQPPPNITAGELFNPVPFLKSVGEKGLSMIDPRQNSMVGQIYQAGKDQYHLMRGEFDQTRGGQLVNQAKAAYNGDPEAVQSFATDIAILASPGLKGIPKSARSVRSNLAATAATEASAAGRKVTSAKGPTPANKASAPASQKYSEYKSKFGAKGEAKGEANTPPNNKKPSSPRVEPAGRPAPKSTRTGWRANVKPESKPVTPRRSEPAGKPAPKSTRTGWKANVKPEPKGKKK